MKNQTTDASDGVLLRKSILNSQLANFVDPDPEEDVSDDDGGGTEGGPGSGNGPGKHV